MGRVLLAAAFLLAAFPAWADDGSCDSDGGAFGFLGDVVDSVNDAKDFVESKISDAHDRAKEGIDALKEQTPDDLLPWGGAPDPGTRANLPPCNGRGGGLKVMSYNIRSTRESSLNQIARDINASAPDFVALQEVDRNAWRTGHKDQPKELATRTGLTHSAFGNAGRRNFFVNEYGNAILSKYQIIESKTYHLPSGTEPRVMICATVITPGGKTVACSTHLGLNAAERQRQVAEIDRILASYGTDRIVLMGDFNARPGDPPMRFLRNRGYRDAHDLAGSGTGFTSTPANPNKRIDYILLSPGLSAGCTSVPTVRGSDHLPVVSTVY